MKTNRNIAKLATLVVILTAGAAMAQTSGPTGQRNQLPPPPPQGQVSGTQGGQLPPPPPQGQTSGTQRNQLPPPPQGQVSGTQGGQLPPPPPATSGTKGAGLGQPNQPMPPTVSGSMQPPPPMPPRSRGIRMNLEVGDYAVMVPPTAAFTDGTFSGPRPPALPVNAALCNDSRSDIAVGYDTVEAAKRKIDIRLYNAEGDLIWSNAGETETAQTSEATLESRHAWKIRDRIPLLTTSGSFLPTGLYSVEAVAGGDEIAAAKLTFEVVPNDGSTPPVPPPTPDAQQQQQ